MEYLIVTNSSISNKTARFWAKNNSYILSCFPKAEVIILTNGNLKLSTELEKFDVIILIGSDRFYNFFVNSAFQFLNDRTKLTAVAFIPDRRNSALSSGMGLPQQLSEQIELINSGQSVLLDLVRCHYIDNRGFPKDLLALNDVLIGIPPLRLPLLLRTIAGLAKTPPILPSKRKTKEIQLLSNGCSLYEGSYVFSMILLGSRITDGPKVRSRVRANINKFDYFQLNSQTIRDVTFSLPGFFSGNDENANNYLFIGKYDELTIKGDGQENTIIVDGQHVGRLPATFTLLPKALRVISPMISVRVKQSWKPRVIQSNAPKPIGSGNNLKQKPMYRKGTK